MEKIKFLRVISTMLLLFTSIISSFSASNFEVSPIEITESINTSSNFWQIITITNTGNTSLNLTITKQSPTYSNNFVDLILSKTQILDLSPTNSTTLNVSLNFGIVEGLFQGSLLIQDNLNSSLNKSIPVSLNITNPNTQTNNVYAIDFLDLNENSISYIRFVVRKSETDKEKFYIKNIGNQNLTDFRLSIDEDERELDDSDFEFEIDGDRDSTFPRLDVGLFSDRIDIIFDAPSDINSGLYNDINLVVTTDEKTFTLPIIVEVLGSDDDVEINRGELDVDYNGVLTLYGDEGEIISTDNEFRVENVGGSDLVDLRVELDGDLEGEFIQNLIPASEVTFYPQSFNLDEDEDIDVEVKVNIPENTPTGDYLANIKVLSATGLEYDKILLKVKVVGDIYISKIEGIDKTFKPGENLDLKVTVRNKGNKIYRDVQIKASIFDIDNINSDLFESTSNFLLDVNQEKTQTLRFKIPEDASDGSSAMEIRVQFGGEEIVEIKDIKVERPEINFDIKSYDVTPKTLKCDDNLYAFIKVRNLGKFDQRIKIQTVIVGTDIVEETNSFELEVDEEIQKNQILDVSELPAGKYKVSQRIYYTTNRYVGKDTEIRVDECRESSVGIDLKVLNESMVESEKNLVELFIAGNKVQIKQGESETLNIGNKSFEIEVISVKQDKAFLLINGDEKVIKSAEKTKIDGVDFEVSDLVVVDNTDSSKINLFGKSIEKTTFYLAVGVIFVFILIVISLFLL